MGKPYRFKRWNRSNNPRTVALDAAIDARKAAGLPLTAGAVARDAAGLMPVGVLIPMLHTLLLPFAGRRLKQRGELIVNDTTWLRKERPQITTAEFAIQVNVKQVNLDRVSNWLDAENEILAHMKKVEAQRGKTITMADVEDFVGRTYEKYGLSG